MYKLIAIDLDGTLLNSVGEISNENKKSIKKAIQNGSKVVIASGRMLDFTKNIAKEVGINEYIICCNGALIYDLQNEQIIYESFLEKQRALEIIKMCEENSMYYNLYTENIIIAKKLNYNLLFYNSDNSNKPIEKRTNINLIEDVYKYVNDNDIKVLKITICDNSKAIFEGILKKIKNISNVQVLEVEHMSRKIIKSGTENIPIEYYYTEISNKNTDKWTAVSYLINKLNISIEETMAIGDNMNDLKMIQNVGLGIAMGRKCTRI